MSFLKQLLKPFVEFDAGSPPGAQTNPPAARPNPAPNQGPTPTPKAAPGPAPRPVPPTAAATPPAAPKPTGPVTHPLINGAGGAATAGLKEVPDYSPSGTLIRPLKEHVQYFEQLIEKANVTDQMFQGADFKEFVDSKTDIDDIADEGLRYRTAFNVLTASGLTREKLLATGQEYINLIGRDLNAFQTAHAQQYGEEVGRKQAVLDKKAEELQQLIQRMNALKSEINQISQDITTSKEKLDTVKQSFLLAGENKQGEIQAELQKIAQFF